MYHNGHVIDYVEVSPGVMEPEALEHPCAPFDRAHRHAMHMIYAVCAIPVVIVAVTWLLALAL